MHDRASWVAALVFASVAVFHGLALLWPTISNPSPPWRHAIFVVVALLIAFAFARKWRWLWLPMSILVVQQLLGHGRDFFAALAEAPLRIDWQSLAVLVAMPALWWVAFAQRKSD